MLSPAPPYFISLGSRSLSAGTSRFLQSPSLQISGWARSLGAEPKRQFHRGGVGFGVHPLFHLDPLVLWISLST